MTFKLVSASVGQNSNPFNPVPENMPFKGVAFNIMQSLFEHSGKTVSIWGVTFNINADTDTGILWHPAAETAVTVAATAALPAGYPVQSTCIKESP